MPRPLKTDADYYPHPRGNRHDRRMATVVRRYGLEGYAVYHMLLENLIESELIQVPDEEFSLEMLAGDMGIDTGHLNEILDWFIRLGLVSREDGFIRSPYLEQSLSPLFQKRKSSLSRMRREPDIEEREVFETGAETAGNPPSRELTTAKERREEESKNKQSEEKEREEEGGNEQTTETPDAGSGGTLSGASPVFNIRFPLEDGRYYFPGVVKWLEWGRCYGEEKEIPREVENIARWCRERHKVFKDEDDVDRFVNACFRRKHEPAA